jgi:hypothetical protein
MSVSVPKGGRPRGALITVVIVWSASGPSSRRTVKAMQVRPEVSLPTVSSLSQGCSIDAETCPS